MVKEIKIQNSDKTFIVDEADYDRLAKYKWYLVKGAIVAKLKCWSVSIGRAVIGPSEYRCVDHIDRNIFNNTRANLRDCSTSQNNANRPKDTQGSSRYKGVSWHKTRHKWRARIKSQKFGEQHLGVFDSEIDAAKAYDKRALEIFGTFAFLNFPQ